MGHSEQKNKSNNIQIITPWTHTEKHIFNKIKTIPAYPVNCCPTTEFLLIGLTNNLVVNLHKCFHVCGLYKHLCIRYLSDVMGSSWDINETDTHTQMKTKAVLILSGIYSWDWIECEQLAIYFCSLEKLQLKKQYEYFSWKICYSWNGKPIPLI